MHWSQRLTPRLSAVVRQTGQSLRLTSLALDRMNRLVHKFKRLRRYWQLFDRRSDMVKYYRCRHRPYLVGEVELQPKAIPHAVLCRPRTSDAAALWGAFGERFHWPPVDIGPGAVILDLGSNVGYTAVDFANLYPAARVIAVEMDSGNAEIARRNLDRFGPRCVVIHAAVWTHEGVVNYEGQDEWGYRIAARESAGAESPTAPAVTIPALLNSFDVDRIRYLKMDIEGAEAHLLSGSANWLTQVDSLKVEVHPPASMSICAAVLEDWGFDVSVGERHGATLVAIRK